ncbi:hypothetical protein [Methylocystis echinoides]|uniref:Peptidase MA-like domain-containing protein n=1 Tax=Methylocystis echinoides TaxID=29468 RepID=A0A9W6GWJ0_9HYPH|nr:hypothetical protein [Methylocystis echinoides]GLI94180.1 hypothetical protein LMG27198_31720 [Methylocystis echinoides]
MQLAGPVKLLASALAAAVLVALAVKPELRAAITAQFNDPASLPSLPEDSRVHYEPAARACAKAAAAALPGAVAKIAAEHGRPFARPPIVGVFADFATYARANGLGDDNVAGVSRAGRAMLSPVMCGQEKSRLASVLAHELSHVHFFGWRPRGAARPPQWFTEGLAVLASDGGAAETVSDADAAQAIRDGYGVILDDARWMNFRAIPFAAEPPCGAGCNPMSFRQRMAYRQVALFIGWLRARDPDAFSRLMRALEGGAAFGPSFEAAFNGSPRQRWTDFAKSLQASR